MGAGPFFTPKKSSGNCKYRGEPSDIQFSMGDRLLVDNIAGELIAEIMMHHRFQLDCAKKDCKVCRHLCLTSMIWDQCPRA